MREASAHTGSVVSPLMFLTGATHTSFSGRGAPTPESLPLHSLDVLLPEATLLRRPGD